MSENIVNLKFKKVFGGKILFFITKIKGLDYEEMYQFRVLLQITKYAIYTKRKLY